MMFQKGHFKRVETGWKDIRGGVAVSGSSLGGPEVMLGLPTPSRANVGTE